MRKIWSWIKNNPNRAMFLVPILLVAGISISHVVAWYDMANPINWAIYLSIAIEVAAITALVAATNKIKGGIWFMFGLVTFIQMIGNIFYSYNEIDANGELFKSWVELTGPVWELMGTEQTDLVGLKRWLAFLEGGLLPIISLTSLHFFVKYEDPNSTKEEEITTNNEEIDNFDSPKEEVIPTEDEKVGGNIENSVDTKIIWETVARLKEEGKLPETTEDDITEEPTALANSKYRNEEYDPNHHLIEEDDPTQDIVEGTSVEKNKTAGEELNRTWLNIIKNRKNNNQIDRV
jgi:hypothetical protein